MQKDKKILKNSNLENSFFPPLKRKKQLEVRLQMMKLKLLIMLLSL